MKNYAKVGKRRGRPAYRTPSRFIYKKVVQTRKALGRVWGLAHRLEYRKTKEKRQ